MAYGKFNKSASNNNGSNKGEARKPEAILKIKNGDKYDIVCGLFAQKGKESGHTYFIGNPKDEPDTCFIVRPVGVNKETGEANIAVLQLKDKGDEEFATLADKAKVSINQFSMGIVFDCEAGKFIFQHTRAAADTEKAKFADKPKGEDKAPAPKKQFGKGFRR